jgi:hypothetical protein
LEKVSQANGPHKHTGVAILILQGRLQTKIRRDNEGHFILIKGTIQQEEISIFNIYAEAPIYIKKPLMILKEQIDPNTAIVGDLNTPLLSTDGSSMQQINKETS